MRCAARRYARGRNWSLPSSSRKSARSSNWSATSALRGSVFATPAMIWTAHGEPAVPPVVTSPEGRELRTVICLPTYNERENLEPMVRALGELGVDGLEVLVIDDASPDGTGEIADRLVAELPWLHVLHRKRKEGLGPAYLAGFRRALELGADLIFEMDCDFSHDPADVPRLAAAAENADLVLGSRYVRGGGTRNWGLLRRFISRGGSLYAQALLQVGIRDLTGGFRSEEHTSELQSLAY